MKTKYYRYTLKGEYSAEDAQRALGDVGSQGLVVRLDNIKGETHVYLAHDSETAKAVSKAAKAMSSVKFKEVSEDDIMKFG